MRGVWESLLLDWQATMRAEHKSPKTIIAYELAVRQLIDHLEAHDRLVAVGEVTRADVQAYISSMLDARSASTANQRYRSLQQWFRWLADVEEEIETSPMARTRPPTVPEVPPEVLTVGQVKSLLDGAKGNDMATVDERPLSRRRGVYISGSETTTKENGHGKDRHQRERDARRSLPRAGR